TLQPHLSTLSNILSNNPIQNKRKFPYSKMQKDRRSEDKLCQIIKDGKEAKVFFSLGLAT
ncbi:hypothetical protein OFB78_31025, partial [Escherichia coli]|nr:hypothetical protein [Escherichia coli]